MSEQLRFWFEQLGAPSGELAVLILAALIFSPLPRLLLVTQAIRLGFNGFPGKFVSFALALSISLVQMEPVLNPIAKKTTELGKGVISAEQRQSILSFSEQQWNSYIESRTLPGFKAMVEKGRPAGETTLGRKATAFLLSELDRAFRMALIIILPLIVIDLLVATSVSALDLKMESEQLSFPLKVALFLSTSGWALITETMLALN